MWFPEASSKRLCSPVKIPNIPRKRKNQKKNYLNKLRAIPVFQASDFCCQKKGTQRKLKLNSSQSSNSNVRSSDSEQMQKNFNSINVTCLCKDQLAPIFTSHKTGKNSKVTKKTDLPSCEQSVINCYYF